MTRKGRKKRDEIIRQLKKSGMEVAEIKGIFGLKKAQVYNILKKKEGRLDKKSEKE